MLRQAAWTVVAAVTAWTHALQAEDVRAAWLTINARALHGYDAHSFTVRSVAEEVGPVVVQLTAYFHVHPVHHAHVDNAHVHVPLVIDGSLKHLVLPLDAHTSQLDLSVDAFCQEHSLIPLYCSTLRQHAVAYTKPPTNRTSSIHVCVASSVTSSPHCEPLETNSLQVMDSLPHVQTTAINVTLLPSLVPAVGSYRIEAWLEATGGEPSSPSTRLSSPVAKTLHRPNYPCTSSSMSHVQIFYPRHGQVVPAGLTHVSVSLPRQLLMKSAFFMVCISVKAAKGECHLVDRSRAIVYLPWARALPHGRHALHVSVTTRATKTSIADGSVSSCIGHDAVVEFEVDTSLTRLALPSSISSVHQEMALVTAVSQSYVDEGRLANLVGSVRVWEPALTIHVVGLRLHPATEAMIRSWPQVRYESFDRIADGLPPHVFDFKRTYAFKPIVIAHYVQSQSTPVLWVDANVELRRPLDRIRRAMAFDGHFFTVQGALFPLAANNHPTTLAHFQCPRDSAFQCWWSGLQGYTRGGVAAVHLLGPMVDCALNETCFAPPASRYPDQTVLNAAVCGLSEDTARHIEVHRGVELWLSSSLDDQQQLLQPSADELDWNDLVLFTRREVPAKPYANYVA